MTVTDEVGKPVAGVKLTLQAQEPQEVSTGPDGGGRIKSYPGSVAITAVPPAGSGLLPGRSQVTVETKRIMPLKIVLKKRVGTWDGEWTDDNGSVVTLELKGTELVGTLRGGKGHEKLTGTIKGFVTGSEFKGVYAFKEAHVTNSGNINFRLTDDGRLEGALSGVMRWYNESRPFNAKWSFGRKP